MSTREVARLAEAVTSPLGEARLDGDVVYAPVMSVDCVGVLLDRRTDRVVVLGSAVGLDTYVWAHQSGFHLHANNVLVVTALRQPDAALEVFKAAFPPRYIRSELAPQLHPARLPLAVELDWPTCALLLDPLRFTDAFDYEVNTL